MTGGFQQAMIDAAAAGAARAILPGAPAQAAWPARIVAEEIDRALRLYEAEIVPAEKGAGKG